MLKNLKSLFFVTEEVKVETEPEKTESGSNMVTSPTATPIGIVDNKILDKLFGAIEENNQDGFDYLEYRQALKSLAAFPMDEATRFQSAFATASTMGVTLEKLLSSIDFYKKVLQNEEDKFKKATKDQSSVNVDGKHKERDAINLLINEKAAQIQKLTEEIRQHQNEVEELNKFIHSSEQRINETTLNFESSFNTLMSQLDQDAQKLKQYIK